MIFEVEVEPGDRGFLLFLLFDKNDQIATHQYNRHIFGAELSPKCVKFAIQRCHSQ